jgi:quinol monooxygenase YgiN
MAAVLWAIRCSPAEKCSQLTKPFLFEGGKIDMLRLNVHLTVKSEADVAKVRELLTLQGLLSRQEPGCLRFEAYQSEIDPKVFFLNEHWASAEALDAHRKAHAYTTIYHPQVLPLVDRTGHPSTLLQ